MKLVLLLSLVPALLGSVSLTQTISANMEASVDVETTDGGTQATVPLKSEVLPDGTLFITPEEV